jgi:hypothetical protein
LPESLKLTSREFVVATKKSLFKWRLECLHKQRHGCGLTAEVSANFDSFDFFVREGGSVGLLQKHPYMLWNFTFHKNANVCTHTEKKATYLTGGDREFIKKSLEKNVSPLRTFLAQDNIESPDSASKRAIQSGELRYANNCAH